MTAPAIRPRPRIAPPPRPIAHPAPVTVKPEQRSGYCKVSELDYCLEPVVIAPALQWCDEHRKLVREWFDQDGDTWDETKWLDVMAHRAQCPKCQAASEKMRHRS
jgi:hypothetical protein